MQIEQVKQAIEKTPKGANIVVEWVRPVKTKKAFDGNITKSCRMVGRIGIEYDNTKSVQEKRENGDLPSENQGLNGMEWIQYPFLLRAIKSGKEQLRLFKGTSDKVSPEVHFFLNGREVNKEEIENVMLASEKTSRQGDCFSCKIENITRIHNEAEFLVVNGMVEQEKQAVKIPIPAKVIAIM